MNKDEWYVIENLSDFIKYSRILVYNTYGGNSSQHKYDDLIEINDKDIEELDTVLTTSEALSITKSIIKKQKHKHTNEIRYLLNDQIYIEIIKSLSERMTSNLLHGLVKKGLIDSAYDDDANDFVFWIKNEEEDNKKPETD